MEKDAAIREENFDLAKQIKQTIERLQVLSGYLKTLEDQKRLAIISEDFDLAKNLKIQINNLKSTAFG